MEDSITDTTRIMTSIDILATVQLIPVFHNATSTVITPVEHTMMPWD